MRETLALNGLISTQYRQVPYQKRIFYECLILQELWNDMGIVNSIPISQDRQP